MTDKQDTHDRTRRRPPESFRGAHTEDGSRHGDGETEGDTTEHSRRRTAATEHTAGRRIGGQAERGTRMAARLGSGGGKHEDDTRQQAGNRERSGREQTDRKKYVIYLRER